MERLLQTLPRTPSTSRGDNGRIGIVGGSVEYPGQPTLSALAGLRTGTDVAKALVPAPTYTIVGSHSPDLLVGRYPGETFDDAAVDRAIELDRWSDALVVGPGLVDATADAVQRVVSTVEVPVVVDAAAIEPSLEADLDGTVFTPDAAETDRITDAYDSVEAFTEETAAVCVMTGQEDTIVADGERSVNETGTSALTVAGTGDTLAGIIAALIGLGVDRIDAAELGAWILGKAGELATAEYGNGVTATDVVERIPKTIR